MSDTLDLVRILAARGEVRISDHGYEELAEDGIVVRDVVGGVSAALLVEDYPNAAHGPSVLVLQFDTDNAPIHILWGIPAGNPGPAVVITGYRPEPTRWSDDFLTRKKR